MSASKKHPSSRKKHPRRVVHNLPGAPPGLWHHESRQLLESQGVEPASLQLDVFDYSSEQVRHHRCERWEELAQLVQPEWASVRWLRLREADAATVARLGQLYRLDSMACEDVVHLGQRPKLDVLAQDLFIVLRHQCLQGESLEEQQISLFYRPGLIISFEERNSDLWASLIRRLQQQESRLRLHEAAYLLYALFDGVVDDGFPLLEHCESRLEEMESQVVQRNEPHFLDAMHGLRRQLVEIRRARWSLRELGDALLREECFAEPVDYRPFLRDVLDHILLQLDMAENYRESLGGLMELHVALMGQRMNEVMKVLTVIATLFIPMTFLAGVYGMNFRHMPELDWPWAYAGFWLICVAMGAGLMWWFRRRGWW